MSLLQDLVTVLEPLGIPLETGVFRDEAPGEYIVITPLTEDFGLYGDNKPSVDIQEARISLYSKGNYTEIKNQLTTAFLEADLTITQRQYIGYEPDTGYHHYQLDVQNLYITEV